MAKESQIAASELAASTSFAAPSLAPPRYSSIFGDPEDDIMRAGTPSLTNHAFSLPKTNGPSKGQPWVTLNLQTRSSSTITKNPRLFGGDNISGTIDLDLDNYQAINSIHVVFKGRIASGITRSFLTFLEERHVIWEKSNSDPYPQTLTRGPDGKLFGKWGKGKSNSRNSLLCQTPATILESSLGANVGYELILQIAHGLLRPDSKLKTIVTYIPTIIPAPPSPLRQNAYLEGTLLPGPDRDPDGWFTLPSVVVRGKLQVANSPMDVQCTLSLSLASPLSYTRGTVIPCYLTLSSQNARALALLADHKLQCVRLARTVQFYQDILKGLDQTSQGKQPKLFTDISEAELAVWWVPPKDVIQETNVRQLQGEIHLSRELLPSSDFQPLCIRYEVQILPFDTKGFEYTPEPSSNEDSEVVLQSYPVIIATANGSGPIPTAFTETRPRRKKNGGGNPLTAAIFSQYEGSFSIIR